ncbi:hypothetical protein GOP47_0019956 [Adiantum capillus-veneris]|uniref:RING-type E3 ubiquitin transferase n=1 Tax=Adiantum capillus-veneris TaxID=13818 RepID=A0A9D4ZA51_ADICA|nr:hypothetical protein GOP47_0019956 [Adiantum capillus-veneris]
MASTQEAQNVSTSDVSMDSSPLLTSSGETNDDSDASERTSTTRRGTISTVFNLIRRRSGRRLMREPSVLVRETAAEQLEERQSEWAYSRPIVILDFLWNLIFVIVAAVVLLMSTQERPSNPLRIWVLGYAAQCCIHMTCVWVEYKRRRSNGRSRNDPEAPSYTSNEGDFYSDRFPVDDDHDRNYDDVLASQISAAKRIESANTSFSFVWWVLGFYWSTTGNQSQNAPLLFWLCAAFLAFDVFFVVFCVSLACIIGVALCCCLPCIIALMYAVAEQEGASEQEINMLPKYKFRRSGSFSKAGEDCAGPFGGVMSILGSTPGAKEERALPAEDTECCICLSSYDDGVEIRELQCSHHFHCACIDRWLRMNSTCPLCKFNVLSDS